jgi:hypothetical protein
LGINVSIQTSDKDVLALIRKLRPVDCGVNLIRVGADGDGGYLIPDDLEGIEYCFSPGVSTTSEFENHLADRHIKSFLADYSVDGPTITRSEFVFDKKFVGSFDDESHFTLASWKDKYLNDFAGDLILQMDIEGHEYEVILSTPDDLLDQFRIIVIEFHNLEKLFDPAVFKIYASCFAKLMKYFHVVHIHPNNIDDVLRKRDIEIPRILEFTFRNKKRGPQVMRRVVFPHPLDRDNIPDRHLVLPKCWYADV